jgi:signal transduction histidine kinase
MAEQSRESAAAIIARLGSRLDQLEGRLKAAEDARAQGQTQVLLKLMRRDLTDLRGSVESAGHDSARLQQLAQVTKLLTSSLELDDVLTDVIDAVIDFLGAKRAFLILTDSSRPHPEIRIARNWAQETLSADEISFSRSIVRHVTGTREPVLTHSLENESWLRKTESAALINVRMVACLPLLVGGQLIGVIYADSTDADRAVGLETARSVLATFADQAAIAIENARVFGQVRSNLNDAQREIHHRLVRETMLIHKPGDIFQMMIRTVAQLLGTPYAALEVLQAGEYRLGAAYGETSGAVAGYPLVFQQETVGRLLLPPEAAGQWMFDILLQQLTVLVYAVQVSVELQHSREKMVIAREEERRRVRDELHDVIGSRLAVMPILFDLVATAERGEAQHLLEVLKEQIQTVVLEIQRFIRQLRPMTLDQVGLYGAIEQLINELNTVSPLRVTLQAPSALPTLSEAVESAAFRIVNEALTNVVRHSGADECTVRLEVRGDEIRIEVRDNGKGFSADAPTGVGLNSMHERAVEVGGAFALESSPGAGTRLEARLPLLLAEVQP